LVTLCAWLMLFPDCGFLPQISHTCAMNGSSGICCVYREALILQEKSRFRQVDAPGLE
jgi:hypothetical protein